MPVTFLTGEDWHFCFFVKYGQPVSLAVIVRGTLRNLSSETEKFMIKLLVENYLAMFGMGI